MKTAKFFAPVIASLTLVALSATAQVGTFQLKSLTPETVLLVRTLSKSPPTKRGLP